MRHTQSKLVLRSNGWVFALALLSASAASQVHAKPKAAKHAAAVGGTATDRGSQAVPSADMALAPAEPAAVPAAAASQARPAAASSAPANDEKPRLQVTSAAAPADKPSEGGAAASVDNAAANEQLAALRADVSALTDDLVEARSRAALLGKTLFKTQVRVRVQNLAAPDPVLVKLVLKLDGAPIFRGDAAALRDDDARQVFQSFIAPGAHVLAAEIEQRSQQDANYGYVLHDSYRFQALRDKRSELTLILDDDSDLASEFPDDAEGEYEVRIKLRVKTKALNEP